MIKKFLIPLIVSATLAILYITRITLWILSILIFPAITVSLYTHDWSWFGLIIGYGYLLFFSIFFIIPLAYYGILNTIISYTDNKHQSEHFTKVILEILHFIEMPVYIEKIQFINTANKRKSTVIINNKITHNSIQHDSIATSIWQRNNKSIMSIFNTFNGKQHIPTDADKFCFCYYSFIEETYYSIEGIFSAHEYTVKSLPEDNYNDREMVIFIKPNAEIELLNHNNQSVIVTLNSKSILLSKKKKDSLLKAFLEQRMTKENFYALLNKIRKSGRLQKEIDMHSKSFFWKISCTIPDEVRSIRITDFCQQRYSIAYSETNRVNQKLLPREITIDIEQKNNKRNYGICLQLDKSKLYLAMQQLTAENPDEQINFSIIVTDPSKESAQITLCSTTQNLVFTECDITFHEHVLN